MLLKSTWMLGKTAPASNSQATRKKFNNLLLDVADLSPTVPWSHNIYFLLLGDSCPEWLIQEVSPHLSFLVSGGFVQM